MITVIPAEMMGLANKGALVEGYDADIVIFDEDVNVDKVIVGGRVIA